MAGRMAEHMGGMILIEILGEEPEIMMNLMMSRGIFIQDVHRKEKSIQMKIRTSAWEAVRALAEERGMEVRMLRRSGVPEMKKKLQKRMGLWLGMLLAVSALYMGSSFIWFIDVQGNEKVDKENILQAAGECGFYTGQHRTQVNRFQVEEELLRLIPELAYAEIKIHGVQAEITVVERVLAGDAIQAPCDIIAKCDGVIEEILLQEGETLVQKGDAVVQGQRLISGVILPPVFENQQEEGEEAEESQEEEAGQDIQKPRLVRARGVVKAKVWYEGYGECPIQKEEQVLSGRQETRIQICLAGKTWTVQGQQGNQNPYADSIEHNENHLIQTPWGNWGWTKKTWQEQTVSQAFYTREEAEKIAKKNAEKDLIFRKKQAGMKNLAAEKIEYHTVSQPSDAIVRVRAIQENLEDIALPRLLEEES